MNVADLRRRIEAALTHSPDVRKWRDEVLDRLNDAQNDLLTAFKWKFRERLYELHCPTDRTLTAANLASGADSLTVTDLITWSSATRIGSDEHLLFNWTGAVVSVPDHAFALHAAVGTFGEQDDAEALFYVERASFVAGGSGDVVLWMEPAWGGLALAGGAGATLRTLRYLLPWDVEEVLDVQDRDDQRGPLRSITTARERRWLLKADDTLGPPTHWLEDLGEHGVGPADSAVNPQWAREDQLHREAPISPSLGLTDVGGGAGNVPAGTYEMCYTWTWGGIESAPSEVMSITVATGTSTLRLAGLETMPAAQGGRHRSVYFRSGEEPWTVATIITDPTATFTDHDAAYQPNANPSEHKRFARSRASNAGHPKWLRLWPRPSTDSRFVVRYLSRAKRLIRDEDVPDMPAFMHQCLVDMVVLAHVASSASPGSEQVGLVRYHEKKLRERMATAKKRYMEQGGQVHVRGSIHGDERWSSGIPIASITWTP